MMRHQAIVRFRDSAQFVCDAVKKGDPTGTADLRRRYGSEIEMRWRKMRVLLRQTIIDQDMLGLQSNKLSPLAIAMQAMPGDGKIRMFQSWLDMTLARVVLEQDAAYLDPMISVAFHRAVARAMRITANPVMPKDMTDIIASLQQLVVVEIQGINEAVSQSMVRAITLAALNKDTAALAFRNAAMAIDKIGIVRSRAMVETMVVKAHGQGTLDQFEAAGLTHVGIIPEMLPPAILKKDSLISDAPSGSGPGSQISRTVQPSQSTINRIRRAQAQVETSAEVNVQTAGDFLVCPECEGIEADGPYTIDEARSLIPAHPYCRCSFVPADDARFGPAGPGLLALLGF